MGRKVVTKGDIDRYFNTRISEGEEVRLKDLYWVIQFGQYKKLCPEYFMEMVYRLEYLNTKKKKGLLSEEEEEAYKRIKYGLKVEQKYSFYEYYVEREIGSKGKRSITITKDWHIHSTTYRLTDIKGWFTKGDGTYITGADYEAFDELVRLYIKLMNDKLGDYGKTYEIGYEEIRHHI